MADDTSRRAPLSHFFAAAIGQRAQWITAQRDSSSLNQDELIHEIRVATKEFRAYLRLLRHAAGKRFCEREDERLQNTARSLAADRDPLVVRETLERLAKKCDQVAGRHSLHRILLHLGEQRLRPGQEPPIDSAVTSVAASARSLARRFARRRSDADLVETLSDEYQLTRKLTRKERQAPDPESWHHWRKQVKSLHYQAGCLTAVLPRKLRLLVKDTWKLQGLLGRHHDLSVTRQRVRRLRVDPINEPCRRRTIKLIDREARRLEKKIGRFTKQLLPSTPKEFAGKLERARRR